MSVTFAVESVHTGRLIVKGYSWADDADVDETILATFTDDAEYQAYKGEITNRDLLWTGYDWFVEQESITADCPSVNMANSNAHDVLTALGLDTADMCGGEAGATFRARVLVAMAQYEGGDGLEPYTIREPGRATWHFGGRPEGYIAEKLASLLKVAESAESLGLEVVWS